MAMEPSCFFHLFFLSLIAHGETHLNLREDDHHHRFRSVVDFLSHQDNAGEIEEAGLNELQFVPNPFTGRFPGLDAALVKAQFDDIATTPAYYENEITFGLDQPTAQSSLREKLDPKADLIFQKLASIFSGR